MRYGVVLGMRQGIKYSDIMRYYVVLAVRQGIKYSDVISDLLIVRE